jgi:hypothetical protein
MRASYSLLGARQNLSEVARVDACPLAMECPTEVHQAPGIGGNADLCLRIEHSAEFVAQHRHARVGILNSERATEATTLCCIQYLDQIDAPNGAQQLQRRIAEVQCPQAVA